MTGEIGEQPSPEEKDEAEIKDLDFDAKVSKCQDRINDYEQSLEAIISFGHYNIWDNDARRFSPDMYFYIGRRMDTSSENKVTPNNHVTPDIFVQRNNDYGIIGEVRKSFPKNREYWTGEYEQAIAYDDNLKGWKTDSEYIDNNDVVYIMHYRRKNDAIKELIDRINRGEIHFSKNFIILVFIVSEERQRFMIFDKIYGSFSDAAVERDFADFKPIPLEKVRPYYNLDFYDAKPTVPMTMNIMWQKAFNQYPPIEDYMNLDGRRNIEITISAADVLEKLRSLSTFSENNDDRQKEYPRLDWVKEALDVFVSLNYAKRIEGTGNYQVKYKRIKDPLSIFIKKYIELKSKKPEAPKKKAKVSKKKGTRETSIMEFLGPS